MNSRQLIVSDGVFTFYFAENSDIGLIPKISMDNILVIQYSQEDFASNISIFEKHSLEINKIVDEIINENKEYYRNFDYLPEQCFYSNTGGKPTKSLKFTLKE